LEKRASHHKAQQSISLFACAGRDSIVVGTWKHSLRSLDKLLAIMLYPDSQPLADRWILPPKHPKVEQQCDPAFILAEEVEKDKKAKANVMQTMAGIPWRQLIELPWMFSSSSVGSNIILEDLMLFYQSERRSRNPMITTAI
jgi:hypothetical protein